MASWVENTAYVAGDPARVALLIALAQSGVPLDDGMLTQSAGLLHQQLVGYPLETAVLMAHIRDLSGRGLLARDASGFRWETTALGELVVRQWASGAYDPPGDEPLEQDEIRDWRDRLLTLLEEDAVLAEQAEVSLEELAAGSALRVSELRVLNRIIADDRLPSWLEALRQVEEALEE